MPRRRGEKEPNAAPRVVVRLSAPAWRASFGPLAWSLLGTPFATEGLYGTAPAAVVGHPEEGTEQGGPFTVWRVFNHAPPDYQCPICAWSEARSVKRWSSRDEEALALGVTDGSGRKSRPCNRASEAPLRKPLRHRGRRRACGAQADTTWPSRSNVHSGAMDLDAATHEPLVTKIVALPRACVPRFDETSL